MKSQIRIVVAAPSTHAVVKMIPDTLKALQGEVAGDLELYRHPAMQSEGIHFYINENGANPRLGLKPNLPNGIDSFIVGNIVASKVTPGGVEVGLTEREAKFACLVLDTLRGLTDAEKKRAK
jgi:hypothetical protein